MTTFTSVEIAEVIFDRLCRCNDPQNVAVHWGRIQADPQAAALAVVIEKRMWGQMEHSKYFTVRHGTVTVHPNRLLALED